MSFFKKEKYLNTKLSQAEIQEQLRKLFSRNKSFDNKYLLDGKVDFDVFFFKTNDGVKQPFQLYVTGFYNLNYNGNRDLIKLELTVSLLRKRLTLVGLLLPPFFLLITLMLICFNVVIINELVVVFIVWLILCFLFSVISYFAFFYHIEVYIGLLQNILKAKITTIKINDVTTA